MGPPQEAARGGMMSLINTAKPLVYVSYAWRSRAPDKQTETQPAELLDREQIVDELCEALANEDAIIVGRDKQLVKTGDSITDFAAEIAKSELIIAVISHKSLRSEWCMKDELLQAFRRRDFDPEEFGQDVLALILDDALPDLEDDEDLDAYWSSRAEKKRKRLQKRDPDRKHNPDSWRDVDRFDELVTKLPDLIRALRIRAMPRGAEAIREKGFHQIRALVKQRLQEKAGLAASISPSLLSMKNNQQIVRQEYLDQQIHFLALVLELSHGSSGESSEPLFSWQAYLKPPSQSHYAPCTLQGPGGLASIGETVRASGLASGLTGTSGLEASSLADLIQLVVDWVQPQSFGADCVLELFLPFELLDFDWSTLQIKDRRSRFGQTKKLLDKIPFVLRCWERFSSPDFRSSRATLVEKYSILGSGDGEWLAENDACSLNCVSKAETTDKQVAIKRLQRLEDDQQLRLQWLDAMQLSMVPVVLWRHHGRPDRTDQELHAYLALYGSTFKGHRHGDAVASDCARFEDIAFQRRSLAGNPLVHDIVFLMDHPGRAPAPASDSSDLISN